MVNCEYLGLNGKCYLNILDGENPSGSSIMGYCMIVLENRETECDCYFEER